MPTSAAAVAFVLLAAAAAQAAPSVEAGIVVRDLRALAAARAAARQKLERTGVGRAYYQSTGAAFSLWRELEALSSVARPSGAQVGCELLLLRQDDRFGVRIVMAVDPDLAARLDPKPDGAPEFTARRFEGTWRFGDEQHRWYAKLDDRELVLADEPEWLEVVVPAYSLSAGLHAEVADGDAYGFILGDSAGADWLRTVFPDPRLAVVLRTLRAVGVSLKLDGGSARYRLAVDAPLLEKLAFLTRKPASAAPPWGDEVASLLVVDAPGHLAAGLLPLLESSLHATRHPLPPALAQALGRFSGRLEVAGFLAPGDWALSLGFLEPGDAAQAVTAVHAYLQDVLAEGVAVVDPETRAVHVRPHPALEGLRLEAVGAQVLAVSQRERAGRLLAAAPAPQESGVAGPLTPLVRATTARQSLLRAYVVPGSDGAWLTWGTWVARLVETTLGQVPEGAPGWVQALAASFADAPLTAAVLGVRGMLLYDAALALELSGSLLVLELATSEI